MLLMLRTLTAACGCRCWWCTAPTWRCGGSWSTVKPPTEELPMEKPSAPSPPLPSSPSEAKEPLRSCRDPSAEAASVEFPDENGLRKCTTVEGVRSAKRLTKRAWTSKLLKISSYEKS